MANKRAKETFVKFGFDNNANVHYTNDRGMLQNYVEVYGLTVDGLGGTASVRGMGSVYGKCTTFNNLKYHWVLHDVLYIDRCGPNILSAHLFINSIPDLDCLVTPKFSTPYIMLNDGNRIDLLFENNITYIEFEIDYYSPFPLRENSKLI